jgi:hypothetical protein
MENVDIPAIMSAVEIQVASRINNLQPKHNKDEN